MNLIKDLRASWYFYILLALYLNTAKAQIISPDLQRNLAWPRYIAIEDSIAVKNVIKNYKHLLQKHNDSARQLLQHILDRCIAANLVREAGWAYSNLANSQERSGLYYSAIQTSLQALDFYQKHKETSYIPGIYNVLGMSYSAIGNFNMSTKYYLKSIETIEKHPTEKTIKIANIYNNLAIVMPDKWQQLNYFDKAYTKAKEIGDIRNMGIALQNKSVVYEELKQYDKSDAAVKESQELGIKNNIIFLQYNAHIKMCYNYLKRDQPEKALYHILEAGKLVHKVQLTTAEANLQQIMTGETYARLKNYKYAKHYLLKALSIAKHKNIANQRVLLYTNLSNIYEETGDYAKALQYKKDYIALNDSILNEKIAQNVNELEVQYRTNEKEKQLESRNQQIKKKNYLIAGFISAGLLLSGFFLLFYRDIRRKNKMVFQEKEIIRLKAAMEGEEQERIRIARELHDGIMVQFSSVKMHLDSVLRRMDANGHTNELHKIVNHLNAATIELRRSAHNLMPDTLLEEGLYGAVAYFCSSVQKSFNVEIVFQKYGDIPEIPSDYALMFYRIIQELVHNALKYACSNYIVVQLDYDNVLFSITVEDDGIGMPGQHANDGSGLGLKNIRSRIELLNGSLSVFSNEGTGTTVYIEVDINQLKKENNDTYIRSYS